MTVVVIKIIKNWNKCTIWD